MTTAAQQYRALVAKLEAIQQLNELKIGDIDPATGRRITGGVTDSEGNLVGSGTPGVNWNQTSEPVAAPAPAPVEEPVVKPVADPTIEPGPTPAPVATEPCGPEVKEKIKQQKTFNAAYAMAKQAGCPDFDWCQIVQVPQIAPKPSVEPTAVTTNPMCDFDPTQFSGQAAAREDIEEATYVEGSLELDRFREIAGTQVVAEAGQMPEIKASSKQAAIAIAQKKGIKTFRFCGKYKVQAAKPVKPPVKPPIAPKPSVEPPSAVTTNPMGDFDPTQFSGQAAARR